MKAAIVTQVGEAPIYGDFPDPVAREGTSLIQVAASALTQLTRGRAAGTHYTSSGDLPFVPGVDGTGTTADGRRVYFAMPEAPFGGMAQKTLVRTSLCLELPPDLDFVKAAAVANAGMSSWAALRERARFVKGETVLINGATGYSGRLAIQIAKFMGATKIIASGRNAQTLASLQELGAQATIDLSQDPGALESDFQRHFSEGVNVVLDYLWGASAEILLGAASKAAPEGIPIRFVAIGSISGPNISLPSAILRSSGLELMGSGLRSVPIARLLNAIDELFHAVGPGQFQVATVPMPLAQVHTGWTNRESAARTVFVME